MIGFVFVSGGADCTPDMVTELSSVPDDISSVTCALVPESLLEEKKEDQSQMSSCLLGHGGCDQVPGFCFEHKVLPDQRLNLTT